MACLNKFLPLHCFSIFLLMLLTIPLLPFAGFLSIAASQASSSTLHLQYIVEAYMPGHGKGLFQFYAPDLINGLHIDNKTKELLRKPGYGFFSDRVYVNVSIDTVHNVVNFTIVIGPGFVAKVEDLGFVAQGMVAYTIARIKKVIGQNISFIIKRSYVYDPKTYMLFTLDGAWAGSTLYLARVNPNRPTFHIILVDPVPRICVFSYSDEMVKFLRGLAHAANFSNLTLQRLGEGQTFTALFGDNQSISVSGGKGGSLIVEGCGEYSIYGVVVDPRIPAKPYTYGSIFVPATDAVSFGTSLPRENFSIVIGFGKNVTVLGRGLAIAVHRVANDISLFAAINVRYLPLIVRKHIALVLGYEPEGIIVYSPLMSVISSIASIRGEYHVAGYLLWAETSSIFSATAILAPGIDVAHEYFSWGGYRYYQLVNASSVRVRLVSISGSPGLPTIVPRSLYDDYLLVSGSIAILVFSVAACFSAYRVRHAIRGARSS